MPLPINLRHLEQKGISLKGEPPTAEVDLESIDELIHPTSPLEHDLEVERHEGSLLVQGVLRLTLACECVPCLKAFETRLDLAKWFCLLSLEGEDKVLI